ncbi:MAG: A/G-specific adenine glycosylase [Chloroflexota bacterium]|nr:A/G-specific adenine glycosylase [Chloroflexota bacterium]
MSFADFLLKWYEQNSRELPWRFVQSPYRTWVSEVMLQQTQVDTMLPYYEKWMVRFPDIVSLANASEQEVLSAWEGLGYYSRVRNLHQAARIVMDEMGGHLPQTPQGLQHLPGIGPYTAAAIASIAFGVDVAAVDGNTRRVLSRLMDVREPARSREGEEIIWAIANENLPQGQASSYNQALMDLGAMICTPKDPDCAGCPVAEQCLAKALGVQAERPVKMPRKKPPHLTVTAAVILRGEMVLLAQRPSHGLLGGMWEFPGGTFEEEDADLEACLKREIMEELGVTIRVGAPFGVYKHAYTHFRITLHAFMCGIADDEHPRNLASDGLVWVSLTELSAYPMGKVDRIIAERLLKEAHDEILPG